MDTLTTTEAAERITFVIQMALNAETDERNQLAASLAAGGVLTSSAAIRLMKAQSKAAPYKKILARQERGEDLVTATRAERDDSLKALLEHDETRHYDGVADEAERLARAGLRKFLAEINPILNRVQS